MKLNKNDSTLNYTLSSKITSKKESPQPTSPMLRSDLYKFGSINIKTHSDYTPHNFLKMGSQQKQALMSAPRPSKESSPVKSKQSMTQLKITQMQSDSEGQKLTSLLTTESKHQTDSKLITKPRSNILNDISPLQQ